MAWHIPVITVKRITIKRIIFFALKLFSLKTKRIKVVIICQFGLIFSWASSQLPLSLLPSLAHQVPFSHRRFYLSPALDCSFVHNYSPMRIYTLAEFTLWSEVIWLALSYNMWRRERHAFCQVAALSAFMSLLLTSHFPPPGCL